VWAVLLAGFAVLLLVLCFAEAASHFDEPGSGYVYTREAFGNFVGFEVGWMTWLARVASVASLSNGFYQALTFLRDRFEPVAALWPEPEWVARTAIIAVPLAILTWINVVGVKHGARLAVGLTIAKVAPLVVLVAVGVFAIDWSRVFPVPAPDTSGFGEATLLLLFAYAGFENTAAAAGEFKNPRRDVPFALMFMIISVTVLYTLVQLVALGTLPNLAELGEGAPLADAAVLLMGTWAGVMMTLGAAISIEGNVGNTMLAGPRYLYALAVGGFGPSVLARVHPKYRTPAWAIITQAVLALGLALSGTFVQLALLSIIARLATYMGTAAAVPFLRRKFPRTEATFVLPGGPTIPIAALLLCLVFLSSTSLRNLIFGAVALVIGVVIYTLRRRPAEPAIVPPVEDS
jgi:amino acid transporter